MTSPLKKLSNALIIIIILATAPTLYASNHQKYLRNYKILLHKYLSKSQKQGIQVTLVDYQSWGKDPLHTQTMHALLHTNNDNISTKEKMSFWINAYNLLTIDLIIKTNETKSIKNQGSILKNVWKSHYWIINGQNITLDEIEHQILRPMGDPRIHAAINCASISCPDLAFNPYIAKNLNQQLNTQMSQFIKNPKKGVFITKSGLMVSQIFKWFAKDFGNNKNIEKTIYKYLPQSKGKKITKYLKYNWTLNSLNSKE